jgi:hypothetical protein
MPKPKNPKIERRHKKRSTRRATLRDPYYLEPGDWEALAAAAAGRERVGRSLEISRKLWEARRRNFRRAQDETADRLYAARAARTMAKLRRGTTARVLEIFQERSTEWLGLRDVIRLSGVGRNSVHAIVYTKLARWGLIERARNPAYVGKGDPWTRWATGAGNVEPLYLWRVTALGQGATVGTRKGA